MKVLLALVSWRSCRILTIVVLTLLIVLNFYGLHTDKFYLLKPDNYIFPILTIVHFTFLSVVSFKLREGEYTDIPMRNLEYVLYGVSLVYFFKAAETMHVLLGYNAYSEKVIPPTFLPVGIFMLLLEVLLLLLTYLGFAHRKVLLGTYNFDNFNKRY